MDLVGDPIRRGTEESDHPGIFFGRVAETNVGVTYVPNLDDRTVHVTFIDTVD